MKGAAFWIVGVIIVIVLVGFHVTDNNEGYFEPVADVYMELDVNARAMHTYDHARGYRVRGGTLTAHVIGVERIESEDGVRRANVNVEVGFAIDNHYHGWGWSRLDRPIIYGWLQGARGVGEDSHRHTESVDGITFLSPIPAPMRPSGADRRWRTRYAPSLHGSCSTDYRHDWCRWNATLPITGDVTYVNIHMRERFR